MRLYDDIGLVLKNLPTCGHRFKHGFDIAWEAYHISYAGFYELENGDFGEEWCLGGFLRLPEYAGVIELADMFVALGESVE